MFSRPLLAAAFTVLAITPVIAAERPVSKVTVVFDRPLPNVPGKSMRGVIVDYAPGAASPAHRHPKSAFIYRRPSSSRSGPPPGSGDGRSSPLRRIP